MKKLVLILTVVLITNLLTHYFSRIQGQLDACNKTLLLDSDRVRDLNLYCEFEDGRVWVKSFYARGYRYKVSDF